MKAKTISIIKDILEQNYNTAFTNFRNIEGNLMDKYGANYNTSVTPSEKETFLNALHEMNLRGEISDCVKVSASLPLPSLVVTVKIYSPYSETQNLYSAPS